MGFGERLAKLRKSAGLTQEELGHSVGVTHSMIAQIERGTKGCNIMLAYQIAKTLGCDLNTLVLGKEAGQCSQ